jgi:hypothetical protein
MTQFSAKRDLLSQLLYEAQSYKKFEDIEKLVEAGMDLSMIPLQPLYVSLQNTAPDQIAVILPKLSSEQRQALRDVDLWKKDNLDPEAAFEWLEIYSKCADDGVVQEFVESEDFLLTLKNQFTVQTFDAEDPMYPEGNNYFLTEDNQLLVEYPEDFTMVNELKDFIRRLYYEKGVENAYAFLFKMVVDSYQMMEETNYQEKIERLRDFGFVDYYEALGMDSSFLSEREIDAFIKNKKSLTGMLDSLSANQSLHSSSLTPFQTGMEGIKESLNLVSDEARQQYLHFNFVRLVNARMTLEDALKSGSTAMGRVGNQARQSLELGHAYVLSLFRPTTRIASVFEAFDFIDLYRVGHSLLELQKKRMKKVLTETGFDEDEAASFLGMYWTSFLENSEEEVVRYKFDGSSKPLEVRTMESFALWKSAVGTFTESLPFIQSFHSVLQTLKADGLLNDEFYLNYEVDNVDFEAIMISSFINFVGGYFETEERRGKMGVTLNELRSFYHKFFTKNGEEYLIKGEEDPQLRLQTLEFVRKFGLEKVPAFERYLYQIMVEQLNGYEIDGMEEEEFKHVGGPIILNTTRN